MNQYGKDGTNWEEVSEKNGASDWEELVVKWSRQWFKEKKDLYI